MQQESINNACRTPNLAVCILLTLTSWECIWETTKHTKQENLKIRASKSSRTSWRSPRYMNACNWHQTYDETLDSNKKYFYDFVNFFVFFEN